jgi:decaprenylphospho-beta-D-erythro-pentofuranosid-2-ulose 2-reductase
MNDAFGRPQSVLVLGGTSDIAMALVDVLVAQGCHRVVLAGRDRSGLGAAAERARQRGADFVATVEFDATDTDGAGAVVEAGFAALGQVDLTVIAVGLLSDDESDERDPGRVARSITVNFTWPASALTAVAAGLRKQGCGRALVLSSVAGVRVRRANYIYGSAKAGLDAYARMLDQTLEGTGGRIQVVRPGFVRSKMTEGRRASPLATTPDKVAADMVRGLEAGSGVIWSPALLRLVFGVLVRLPNAIWRRLPV